nr:sigma-70 family RNA polymerase sigma factor [Belliella kenyensis]
MWNELGKRNREAFKYLYAKNYEVYLNYGLKITSDTALIEDCIQDFYLYLYEFIHKLQQPNNVEAYFFSMFRNKLSKSIQSLSKISTSNLEYNHFEIGILSTSAESTREEMVGLYLNTLPIKQKEAISLKFLDGLDYDIIAKSMNITIESCRTLVYRGLKTLRSKFSE